MASKGEVDIGIKLRGAREFATDANRVERSIGGIQRETVGASRSVTALNTRTGSLRRTMGRLGGITAAAGGALAAFGLVEAKEAIDATLSLGVSTMKLNRMTQMGVQESSRFAAVAKIRGIEDRKMGMTITRLSTAMLGYRKGTESAREALDFFGVSQDAIRSNDFQSVLVQLADGYKNSTDAAKKNVYMQQLLGRTWQDLAPLFAQGGKGLRDELGQAAIFKDLDVKNVGEFRKAMRDTQYASLRLQVTLGKKIVPALGAAARWVTKFMIDWDKSGTTANDIRRTIHRIAAILAGTYRTAMRVRGVFRTLVAISLRLNYLLMRTFGGGRIFSTFISGAKRAGSILKSAFGGAVSFVKGLFRNLKFTFKLPPALAKLPGPDSFTLGFNVPGLANGGLVMRPGVAMVGERGPELLSLPRGAQVQPLAKGAGFGGTVVTKVYLDRRQIAEAVGSEVSSRAARR